MLIFSDVEEHIKDLSINFVMRNLPSNIYKEKLIDSYKSMKLNKITS